MSLVQSAAIVIVDDDPAVGAVLTRLIQRWFPHHPVYACQQSAEAVAYVTHTVVACIITDYHLGRETGDTLAQTIHASWPDLPLILLTGLPPAEDDSYAVHVVTVLTKPIPVPALRTILQVYLLPGEHA